MRGEELTSLSSTSQGWRAGGAAGAARSEARTKFIGNSNLPVLVGGDLDQISDQLHRASLWVTNPNINSVGLPAAGQASGGPIIRDISDVVF